MRNILIAAVTILAAAGMIRFFHDKLLNPPDNTYLQAVM